ncbi:MAG: FIST C-terminal domain-containing protein [Cytophagales bacterium]|nr:FIST C-terminal domain-containing protein [Cytophagales bacterium]
MKTVTAFTKNKDIKAAVSELRKDLDPKQGELLLFFASSCYNVDELAMEMDRQFQINSIGCTTAGELVSGQMLDESIVAMCLEKDVLEDHHIEIVEDIHETLVPKIDKAFGAFGEHFGSPVADFDFQQYVGLLLVDGLSNQEEMINNLVGNKSDIVFIGGSAGDDLAFEKTYVFANGKAYSNAAVLVLIKPTKGYDVLKTQSFKSTSKKLKVTKLVEGERRIQEFNGKPATQAYAESLNCALGEVESRFIQNPVGLMINDDEPFVRSPRVTDGTDILFYCGVKEGQNLDILESTDIVNETTRSLVEKSRDTGPFSCLINFNCVLRKLELIEKKQEEAYGNVFSDIPTIGFHTYGESYIGHMNQTATILLLK